MSYKNCKETKLIIKAETEAILKTLDDLVDRHIYIGGTVCDLLELDDEKKAEKATEYIQNKIVENVKNSELLKEFNLIFGGK